MTTTTNTTDANRALVLTGIKGVFIDRDQLHEMFKTENADNPITPDVMLSDTNDAHCLPYMQPRVCKALHQPRAYGSPGQRSARCQMQKSSSVEKFHYEPSSK